MKTTTNLTTALAILVAAALSCSQPKVLSPMERAVTDKVLENNPSLEYFTITAFAVTDTVTLSQELERRTRLFLTKEKVERDKARGYEAKSMPTNAEKHRREARKATRTLKAIERFVKERESSLDSVVYYVCRFSGYGYTDEKALMQVAGMQAAVGTDLTVYQTVASDDNIFSGMGRAIPGYLELIKKTNK